MSLVNEATSVKVSAKAGGFARTPLKQQGRARAVDELRARCVAHVREGRERLLSQLRDISDEKGVSREGLQSFTRDIIREQCDTDEAAGWDLEDFLELENAILAELQLEAT